MACAASPDSSRSSRAYVCLSPDGGAHQSKNLLLNGSVTARFHDLNVR
jgi:hypothetical protein